ncbi:ABC transporter ATP-binding protein [Amycolatopsis sp. TRM77291]
MNAPILELDHVTVRFGGAADTIPALQDFSLRVEDGEILMVVGPSGCGKTTVLNLAAGLLPPTSGQVTFEGQPVTGPDPRRGVVFQQYALFPWMTVRQNVEYGLKLKKVPRAKRRAISDEYLSLVGLPQAADKLPKELSGGMKQRTAIARAYAVDPHMLLMDEPFGALDAQTRLGLQLELARTWQQTRKTILFITHDIDEALLLGHRVAVLSAHPGRLNTIIDVPFAHPRTADLQQSPDYQALRAKLFELIYSHA